MGGRACVWVGEGGGVLLSAEGTGQDGRREEWGRGGVVERRSLG